MLARIAVPKGILSIVLPPLTLKTGDRALWVNFWSRAGSIVDDGEGNAIVDHGAAHEFVDGWSVISECAFCGAVLIQKLHWGSVVVVVFVASVLT